MRCSALLVIAAVSIGCSNLGPFRAEGDSDPDAAVSPVDGQHADASTPGDGPQAAQPRLIATSTHYPTVLAAAGGTVYFTELGTAPYSVARVPAVGGSVSRINLGSTVPLTIAASGSTVVWATSTTLMRANSAFSSGDTLVTTTSVTGELALSSSHLYYARSPSGTANDRIERVALAGGSPEALYTTLDYAPELAANGTDLFWTTYAAGYELRRSALSAPGTFTTVASVGASNLVASGSTACWSQQPDPNQYLYDVWCNVQGTTSRIARNAAQVFDIAVTASEVFIAIRGAGNSGHIERYHLSTHVLDDYITLGAGELPTALASDGTDLFWVASSVAVEGSGTVYALAL